MGRWDTFARVGSLLCVTIILSTRVASVIAFSVAVQPPSSRPRASFAQCTRSHSMLSSETVPGARKNGNTSRMEMVSSTSQDNNGTEAEIGNAIEIVAKTSPQGPLAEGVDTTKILNACLLILSLGWVLYTILGIDAGMTRGWTQQEIMMRIPVDNWRSYEFKLNENPMQTKTAINVIIYLLGDWLSQTLFQKKNVLDFDAMRTLKNGFIGLCFGPAVHLYYELSDTILPVDGPAINRIEKIFMDQTIYLSVKCSIYIVAVGVLNGSTFEQSVDNAKNRIKDVMFTAWSFWPLVHCVTYTVIPARHRILWVNCVDLIWNAILATKTGKADTETDADAESVSEATQEVPDDADQVSSQRRLTSTTKV